MKCPKCGADANHSAIQGAALIGIMVADGIIVESAILAGYIAFPIIGVVAGIAARSFAILSRVSHRPLTGCGSRISGIRSGPFAGAGASASPSASSGNGA